MAKIKLTKSEWKAQKDALKMYQRYLPTLTLKKQQLQSEIRVIEAEAREVRRQKAELEEGFSAWIAVFCEESVFPRDAVSVRGIRRGTANIAGVEIPTFEGAQFERAPYDLYETPLWVDIAVSHLEQALSLDLRAQVLEEQVALLQKELRATSQRVNLFEKVKIPETKANIKKIAIYMSDQQVSAVVRSKLSKKKLAAPHPCAHGQEVSAL